MFCFLVLPFFILLNFAIFWRRFVRNIDQEQTAGPASDSNAIQLQKALFRSISYVYNVMHLWFHLLFLSSCRDTTNENVDLALPCRRLFSRYFKIGDVRIKTMCSQCPSLI